MPIQASMCYGLIHYKCSSIPFMFPKQWHTVIAWSCTLQQISLLSWLTKQHVCSSHSLQCRPAKYPSCPGHASPTMKGLSVEQRWKQEEDKILPFRQPDATGCISCLPTLLWWTQSEYSPYKVVGLWLPFSHSSTQSLSKSWEHCSTPTQLRPPCSGGWVGSRTEWQDTSKYKGEREVQW